MTPAAAILAGTNWPALTHAYGPAGDLPFRLAALIDGTDREAAATLSTLESAVAPQGRVYSCTAPVARYVAAVLGSPRTGRRVSGRRSLRADLLDWLAGVAATGHVDGICGEVYRMVALWLDDEDGYVRAAATGAAGHLLRAPSMAEYRDPAADRLLTQPGEPYQRANAALAVARFGHAPAALLTDAVPGVRAYAALAAALDRDPRALTEVRAALTCPDIADTWFAGQPMLLQGWPRFALIRALLRRTRGFDDVAAEAVAVARMTSAYTVDDDWGPLLRRAFDTPYLAGRRLSAAQRDFLTALTANDHCWGTPAPARWFARAGLPAQRDRLRALL